MFDKFTIGILVVLSTCVGLHSQQVPQPPEPHSQPCIGYLMPNTEMAKQGPQTGDVFVNCWGRTIQLTNTGNVLSWAIDTEQAKLMVVSGGARKQDSATLAVILLASGKVEKTSPVSSRIRLVHTCGTVMSVDDADDGLGMASALTGAKVQQEVGATQIRCDDQRKTTLSLQKATSVSGGPLLFGTHALGATVSDFDVSPGGRFLAFNEVDKLCVYDKETQSKSCLAGFSQIGRMSVWDDGIVAAAAETSQACPLTPRLTTVQNSNTWPCPALFEWKAGQKGELIQFLGTNPQILPAQIGNLLITHPPKIETNH